MKPQAPPSDFSLAELLAEARARLAKAGLAHPQGDGRVSPVPDERTVRYYGTLGLVDRPSIQGKDARYGRRHLLQVLAVKALQADGLRLTDIQRRLYGRSTRELEAINEAALTPRPATVPAPVIWRELMIEPGLKLFADDQWKPSADHQALDRKFHAAIAALTSPTSRHREGEDQ